MNTSLGIKFFRTVNEEGSNGWAQVYARIPFDDYELKDKGALFGVVIGKSTENWTEIEGEVMEWVDQYFNKVETGGGMGDFGGLFREKYPEVDGAWLWITLNDSGGRELKMIRWGEAGVLLRRDGQEYDLAGEEGKVVRGMAMKKDAVVMWSGQLKNTLKEGEFLSEADQDKIALLGNLLTEAREAGAGLFFDFEEMDVVVQKNQAKERVEEIEVVKEVRIDEDLAGEILVGPVGTKERLINWWKQKRLRGAELRVDREGGSKRKKWAVMLGIIFLVLLMISLVTGSIKIKADREAKKWRDFSEPITKNIQEAEGLMSINPAGARKLVEDVRAVFDVQRAEFVQGKYANEVVALEEKINKAWTVTSGEKQSQIEEAVNIQLVREGFEGERLSLVKGSSVAVVDSKLGTVVTVDVSKKDIKVVAGKGEGLGWIDAINDGTKTYILNLKGVSVDNKTNGGIVFDLAVNKAVALGRFGANIYVLDGGNKEIYKYGAISDGFGDRSRWLKQDQSMVVVPVDMAIDADVWILGENGSVEKYRRGAKEQFSLSGVSAGTKTTKLAVEQTGVRLAMLDTTKGVVIVCNKETGVCDSQLLSEKLKTARDIEFDESNNLLVLLPGVIGVLK